MAGNILFMCGSLNRTSSLHERRGTAPKVAQAWGAKSLGGPHLHEE